VCLRPVVACEAHVVAQQKLPDPMASTHQIAAHILTRAHQIAQRLLAQRRHPDRRQLARHQQPHQKLGVTAIGLYPVLRRPRDLPQRRHQATDTGRLEPTREPEPRRPRLIAHPHRACQPRAELHHPPRRARQPLHPQLARLAIHDRRDHPRRVHTQTRPGP